MFVVGIFSGADQLGEGFGSSLKMAEYRVRDASLCSLVVSCSPRNSSQAAEDSLLRLYLTRQPPHLLQLPTSTFPDMRGSVIDGVGAEGAYSPVSLGDSEVLFGSAGRVGARVPGARSRALEDDDLEDYM